MCEQCSAETNTFTKKVFDKYWVVQATCDGSFMEKGDYGLVICNDPDFLFENVIEVIDDDEQWSQIINWFDDDLIINPERTNNSSAMCAWNDLITSHNLKYPEASGYDICVNLLKEIKEAIDSGIVEYTTENEE